MADAHALGACAARHGGSSPLLGTFILYFQLPACGLAIQIRHQVV